MGNVKPNTDFGLKFPISRGGRGSCRAEVGGFGGSGFGGLFLHRGFGQDPKTGSIEIINNSPMIASLNAMLSSPIMGGMMRDENQKQIKVQGYKSLLTKSVNSDTGKTGYELQVPMNNTLMTIKMDDSNESEITTIANGIPLSKIAQMAQ